MLPIAITASPRTIAGAISTVLACWLVPHTSVAAGACVLALIVGMVVATALAMAHLAADDLRGESSR